MRRRGKEASMDQSLLHSDEEYEKVEVPFLLN
jgi:hypothetical protein